MFAIPDLFSAYTKGQEDAIDQNWQDLKNYEDIERARTENDMRTLDLWYGLDTYGNKVANSNFDANHNARTDTVEQYTMPTLINNAHVGNVVSGAKAGAVAANQEAINRGYSTVLVGNLANMTANGETAAALANDRLDNSQMYIQPALTTQRDTYIVTPNTAHEVLGVTSSNAVQNAQNRQRVFDATTGVELQGLQNQSTTLTAQAPNIVPLVTSQAQQAITGNQLGTAQNTAMIPHVPTLVGNQVATSNYGVQGAGLQVQQAQQSLGANADTIAYNQQSQRLALQQYYVDRINALRQERINIVAQADQRAKLPMDAQGQLLMNAYRDRMVTINAELDSLTKRLQALGGK